MKSEYIRLSAIEVGYGKSHALQSELELLNLIKSYRKYKKLRSEEFVLKVTLKKLLGDTLESLSKLSKSLPKSHLETEREKKEDTEERKKNLTLQEEIEEVRKKLAKLQKNI